MKRITALFALAALLFASAASAQTVRIAGWDGDANVVNGLLQEIVEPMLEGEGITIVYEPISGDFPQYLTNSLSAGTAPDLFYVDIFWSEGLFRGGSVATLDDAGIDRDAFLPVLIDAFVIDGSLYGVPKDFNTLAVQYNMDIFDEAGVEYPNENDDWDSFKEKLQAVQANLDDTYGICVMPDFARFGAFAYATGWQPFTAEGHTDLDADFRRAFEYYVGLVEDGAGVTDDAVGSPGWTGGCFATDQVAVAMEGQWIGNFLRDQAPNLAYGTTFVPMDPESGERGNFVFTVSWSLNAASANRDAALTVLDALTSPEAQQWILENGLAIPSREALADNPFLQQTGAEAELARVVFEGASDGNVIPFKFLRYGNDWKVIIDEALSAVLLGELTVDAALFEAQARLDQLTGR